MNFKTIAAIAILLTSATATTWASTRTLIDRGWTLNDGSAHARTINLPHDWSVEGSFDPTAPAGNDGAYLPTAKLSYTKTLQLTPAPGRRYSLVVEGAYMNARVIVNGVTTGFHPYGYSTFSTDITDALHTDTNSQIVEITVDNTAQKNCRWYTGTGIYRHVWLEETPSVRFTPQGGVFFSTTGIADGSASVAIDLAVDNLTTKPLHRLKGICELTDANGAVVAKAPFIINAGPGQTAKAHCMAEIESPRLWSPENPELYTLRAMILDTDTVTATVGIRAFEYSADDGLRLNGLPIILNGGCVHHDNGLLGAASHDAAEAWKVTQLKRAGFNAVRTSHNPPSPTFLDECDRQGLVVIDESFDGWRALKTTHDYASLFDQWALLDVEAMVMRDRNHPSIMCWSIGNEIIERKSPEAVTTARALAAKCRELDPTRPVTSALASWDADWEIYDPLAAEHEIVGYNYMIHKSEGDHERVPSRVMWQTESYPRDAWSNYLKVRDNSYIIGDFVWTALDYLGESGIGRHYYEGQVHGEHWERDLWPWHGALCGDIDITGMRKPISHYRDMLWNPDRTDSLYMAVREPNGYKGEIKQTLWGNYPTYESWNWPGHEEKLIDVELVSIFPKVRLWVNGEYAGEKETGHEQCLKAVFEVPYAAGELKAVGVRHDGSESAPVWIRTTRPAVAAEWISTEIITGLNDGIKLCYMVAAAVDSQGQVVPDFDGEIEVTAQGEWTLLGCGSADMTDTVGYTANRHRASCGRVAAVARIDGEGALSLTLINNTDM